MEIDLPQDLSDSLADRLTSGQYGSEEDVLREAMDALDAVEEQRLLRWNERNQLSEEQSDHGESRPLNDQAVLGRLRKRLQSEGIID